MFFLAVRLGLLLTSFAYVWPAQVIIILCCSPAMSGRLFLMEECVVAGTREFPGFVG
jgi:hypothetical protein